MDARKREQLESQLSAYLDDELTLEEVSEVEAFLADDAEARTLLAELRATVRAVKSLPRARAPDDLMESLHTRLERQALLGPDREKDQAAERITPFHGRWIAAAAVIALTFAAGYLVWSLAQEESLDQTGGNLYVMRETTPETEQTETRQLQETTRTDELLLADATETRNLMKMREKGTPVATAARPATIATPPQATETPSEGMAVNEEVAQAGVAIVPDAAPESVPPAAPSEERLRMLGAPAGVAKAPEAPDEGWTVVELTYADALGQANAADALRARYGYAATHGARMGYGVYAKGGYAGGARLGRDAPSRGSTLIRDQADTRRVALPSPTVLEEDKEKPADGHFTLGATSRHAGYWGGRALRPEGDAAPAVLRLEVADHETLANLLENAQADTGAIASRILTLTPATAPSEPVAGYGHLLGTPADDGARTLSLYLRVKSPTTQPTSPPRTPAPPTQPASEPHAP